MKAKKLKIYNVEMTLVETTSVAAYTRKEALELVSNQGFGGTVRHVKTIARLDKVNTPK